MSCQLSTINYQIMIKHIFKIIWAQRKSNGWILGELVIVMCALWFMMDKLWVDVRCYNSPMGYDISNTWRFKLSTLSSNAPGYVPDSLYDSNATQDLLKLMERIRQEQESRRYVLRIGPCLIQTEVRGGRSFPWALIPRRR